MTYQFQCPQGHPLMAEPEQEGRICQCPQCGLRLRIPPAPVTSMPDIVDRESGLGPWRDEPIKENPFPTTAPPEMFHIPCPQGHVLETSPEMLGKLALCPQCGEKFKLDQRQSSEFRAAEAERQAAAELRLSRRWLHGAIVAVVLTLLGVLLLFLVGSAFRA